MAILTRGSSRCIFWQHRLLDVQLVLIWTVEGEACLTGVGASVERLCENGKPQPDFQQCEVDRYAGGKPYKLNH